MNKTIEEYSKAIKNHLEAVSEETTIKQKVIKTHYDLLKAKENLRAMERDLLVNYESNG